MWDAFLKIIEKSSSADMVLLAVIWSMVWMVLSKKKIPRETIEIALKYLFYIAGGMLLIRLVIALVPLFGG